MSNNLWLNIRPRAMLCGRFLLCVAKAKREESFFRDRYSNGSASSNGRHSFFRSSTLEFGFVIEQKSLNISLQICEDGFPNMNKICFVFSTILGAAFSRNFFPARDFGGLQRESGQRIGDVQWGWEKRKKWEGEKKSETREEEEHERSHYVYLCI